MDGVNQGSQYLLLVTWSHHEPCLPTVGHRDSLTRFSFSRSDFVGLGAFGRLLLSRLDSHASTGKSSRCGMRSDIHVAVRFHEQCVFAGEQLKCTITFRNVANFSEPTTPAFHGRRSSRQESIGQLAAQAGRNVSAARGGPHGWPINTAEGTVDQSGRHRATASLNTPAVSTTSPISGGFDNARRPPRPGHKKQMSVSIISVPSSVLPNATDGGSTHPGMRTRPSHQRSSTVQIHHGKTGADFHGEADGGHLASQRRPPQYYAETSPSLHLPTRNGRRSPLSPLGGTSRESTPDFKFPPEQPVVPDQDEAINLVLGDESPSTFLGPSRSGRVTSGASQGASERSSGDFYSLSNHSQETLMSEQPSIMSERPAIPRPVPQRLDLRKPQKRGQAANLLMGYAQLSATFILDASLVDQTQFAEVKSKGFLGGHAGGGVVGVQQARPSSGFLGHFNFSRLGESLGSFTGADDMSSVKEMNAVTNARAIPLLSTPQSLLFVDMHLEPGEEKSYEYEYTLPKGLPSSYRGKAIKIGYNLTVGIQGVPGSRDTHAVRRISVPIRVFPSVRSDGEILGHDLMQPHVILRDLARTRSVASAEAPGEPPTPRAQSPSAFTVEFLQFVDTLLDHNRRRQSSSGTMDTLFSGMDVQETRPAMQAINRAILLSNQLSLGEESSPNRFEIVRNGLRVAVVILDRALHRLGETITTVIDFSNGQIACASLHATLESSERVSPSLAVRSASAINRITKKVYASHSENVLFVRRANFSPSIPALATPTFVTSGVNLEWSLRFEFGTIKPQEQEDGETRMVTDLLEEVVHDERGSVNIAVENLECETFEVIIPITVYGDVVPDGSDNEEAMGIPI